MCNIDTQVSGTHFHLKVFAMKDIFCGDERTRPGYVYYLAVTGVELHVPSELPFLEDI